MLKDIFSLKNKTVIITGGAGHLGSAMSEVLARYGADLFITGKDLKKNQQKALELKEKYKLNICESFIMNIDIEKNIDDVLANIISLTGKIDVLVNNAAYSKFGRLHTISFDNWCQGIEGSINSNFRITQKVLNYMLKNKSGNIINIGSMYGMVAPNPDIYGNSGFDNPASYGAGKAAIIQLTRYIAANYAKYGIRANSVSPGPFPSKEVQKNKEFIAQLCEKNPMQRIGRPEDLEGIIIYLASDASMYTNGQNIAVDGGWTIW